MAFNDFFSLNSNTFTYSSIKNIPANTLIEVSPCLDIPISELKQIDSLLSESSHFIIKDKIIFPLGSVSSLGTNSNITNCKLIYSVKDNTLTTFSNSNIKIGEPLTFNLSNIIIADSMTFNVYDFMKNDICGIEVKNCEFGRGVFASRDFKIGETIEVVATLKTSDYDYADISDTKFGLYHFGSDLREARVEFALGFASLYNHNFAFTASINSSESRMEYDFFVRAEKNIKKGEQIFINYGYDPVQNDNEYLEKTI